MLPAHIGCAPKRSTNAKGIARIVMDIEARLFARQDIDRLGIAPFSSMFWYGEANRKQATDWHPEIHDSDGLAILTGTGERIWRPLNNPPRVNDQRFRGPRRQGFRTATARSRISTTTWTTASSTNAALRSGSSRSIRGAKARCSWSKFRRPTRPLTTSSLTGRRKRTSSPAIDGPGGIGFPGSTKFRSRRGSHAQ